MSRWSCHPIDGHLGAHAADWDALNAARFQDHPLLASRFVELLLTHFPAKGLLLCKQHGEGQDAPLAMCLLRAVSPGLWASYMPAQAQISPSMLGSGTNLQSLARSLPGFAGQLDLLCLDPLFCDLRLAEDPLRKIGAHATTMAVDLGIGYDTWWQQRPKKLRDNLGRYGRRVQDDGLAMRITVVSEPSQMRDAVARYGQLESRGWKGQSGTAVDQDSGQLAFYSELMTVMATQDGARVHELWLGDDLVASRLTMTAGRMVVALKTTYDEAFKRYAPGRLLMHEVVRDAFRLWPGRQFEFYTNASADQLAWATSQRPIVHATAFRSAWARRLADLHRQLRRVALGGRRWALGPGGLRQRAAALSEKLDS